MVEVTMPDPEGGSAATDSSVPSGAAASASSAALDVSTLVEKAISVLPSDLAAQVQDPKRGSISRPRMEVWVVARSYEEGFCAVCIL